MKNFDAFFQRVAQAAEIESQQDLAALLGVNRSAITQAKRRDAIPERWYLRLSRVLHVDPVWLETGREPAAAGQGQGGSGAGRSGTGRPGNGAPDYPDGMPEFTRVPKVNARLCAGGGSFEVGGDVEGYYAFHTPWLTRKGTPVSMVMMDVFGNSMEPEIREGDTVLVDQARTNILAGGIYAVGVEDTVMVKRVEKRPGVLALLSDNPDYAPIELRGGELETVRMIGKVVWICREYR